MINSISVNISEIKAEGRFNPKYFYFLNSKNELLRSSKHKYVTLGNKKYFPTLSDGIHSAVELIPEGEIKYLYIHNLKEGFIDTVDNLYISEIDHEKNINKELQTGAVLLSVVGTLGNTALFSDYVNSRCSLPRNIAYIYCDSTKILPEYLTCFFLSEFSKYQCAFSGGGNIQGLLSLTKLKKFIVPILAVEKQKLFAEKYNRALSLQKEFLSEINECKELFYHLLKLDENEVQRKITFSTRISELKEHNTWTPVTYDPYGENILNYIGTKFKLEELNKHITISKGEEIGSDNYLDYLSKKKDSKPFIRTSDIFNYEIDSYPDFYCDSIIYNDLKLTVKTNDITFTKDGSIGNMAIVTSEDNPILSSGHAILRMRKESNLNPFYIFAALSLYEIGQYQANRRTVIASTIPHLRPQNILKFKIPILDDLSKKKISEKVEGAYSLIAEKKRIIKEIKQLMNEEMKL